MDSAGDTLSILEERIEMLLRLLSELRTENEHLRRELTAKQRIVQEIEAEKHSLSTSIGELKAKMEGQREKQETAAEKLELLLAQLESVG